MFSTTDRKHRLMPTTNFKEESYAWVLENTMSSKQRNITTELIIIISKIWKWNVEQVWNQHDSFPATPLYSGLYI